MSASGTRASGINGPDPATLKGTRDRLALLISGGLRRAEVAALEVDRIQQREGRWVIPDLVGNGNRLRTVTIPAAVKVSVDAWTRAAKISEGTILRPVNKGGLTPPRLSETPVGAT